MLLITGESLTLLVQAILMEMRRQWLNHELFEIHCSPARRSCCISRTAVIIVEHPLQPAPIFGAHDRDAARAARRRDRRRRRRHRCGGGSGRPVISGSSAGGSAGGELTEKVELAVVARARAAHAELGVAASGGSAVILSGL